MRHRFRLALAAGAILASAAASVMLFANTGWAGSVPARAGDPKPSSTANPTPNDPPPNDPAPTPSSGPTSTPTGAPTPPEQELPCEGGAAWDDINGSWRPWFGCDDWIFVMEGRFDDRATAEKIGSDQAYIQGRARVGRVKDGPGCLPPLIFC